MKVKGDKPQNQYSLLDHFTPDDGFVGHFGWLCGFSADAPFLNSAADNFTRSTKEQRAYQGKIALALMLTAQAPRITLVDTPGVLQLLHHTPAVSRYRLLHAKIALLGFVEVGDPSRWRVRLLISTGNWTSETVTHSLDYCWRGDISSSDVDGPPSPSVSQIFADISAAWDTLSWLREGMDTSVLSSPDTQARPNPSAHAMHQLQDWLGHLRGLAHQAKPRYFDNRDVAFVQAVPRLAASCGAPVRRNQILMGSGFYDRNAPTDGDLPEVPRRVIEALANPENGKPLLTKSASVFLCANPSKCQSLSATFDACTAENWNICRPQSPKWLGDASRTLHAKFILSASAAIDGAIAHAWMYLGSANLTAQGFLRSAREGGHLEAGMVLTLGSMDARQIADQLIVGGEAIEEADQLEAGDPAPDAVETHFAGPVGYMLGEQPALGKSLLRPPADAQGTFDVLNRSGEGIARDGSGAYPWEGDLPQEVTIRWGLQANRAPLTCRVPVCDAGGRYAAIAWPSLNMEDAWATLATFPLPPDHEETNASEMQTEILAGSSGYVQHRHDAPSAYATRVAMELVDRIGARQTQLTPEFWESWVRRLEEQLLRGKNCPTLGVWRKLQVNVFSPLRAPCFKPDFACIPGSEAERIYEAALQKIEDALGLRGLAPIDGGES